MGVFVVARGGSVHAVGKSSNAGKIAEIVKTPPRTLF
jgi:hypothetical protein